MADSEELYLARRVETSRRLADAATDTTVRSVHLTLAAHHEARLADLLAIGRDPVDAPGQDGVEPDLARNAKSRSVAGPTKPGRPPIVEPARQIERNHDDP